MTSRDEMIARQLRARGITDERVLEAMRRVDRERFVPPALAALAYADRALPLAEGQTISQPYMVARTLELARVDPGARVLDVGTGSGYQAAVLAELAAEVISVERIPSLAREARARLAAWPNVTTVIGDGTLGYPERAPYDAIVSAAAAPRVPVAWLEQLTPDGRVVAPVGDRHAQVLTVFRASGEATAHDRCVYVPLIGAAGWAR